MQIAWRTAHNLESHSYVCGYCGNPLASDKGFVADQFHQNPNNSAMTGNKAYIYICHHCHKPTFFDINFTTQIPGKKFGNEVNDIDDEKVLKLYNEARNCFSQNAFTAVVLSCRKLLMHIAVNKGALAGQSFIQYVEYLSTQGYIPPDAKDWVDHIRQKGNEANHEIVIMKEEDAKDLLNFSEMLLKLIYEFPANIKKKKTSSTIPMQAPKVN